MSIAEATRPSGRAPANKGKKYDPHPYTPVEVHALMQACLPRSKFAGVNQRITASRHLALIPVLYRSGLRIQELLDLEERDLDRATKRLIVRHGKGNKRRRAPMDDFGWQYLDQWMGHRQHLPNGPIFCTLDGGAWDQHDVRRVLRMLGKRAGLRRRCACHDFRHAYAVELYRETGDLYMIMHVLGHARLDVTASYLRGLDIDTITEIVTLRRPPMVPITVTA